MVPAAATSNRDVANGLVTAFLGRRVLQSLAHRIPIVGVNGYVKERVAYRPECHTDNLGYK